MGLEARVGSVGNLDVVLAILRSLVHSLMKQNLCMPCKLQTTSLGLELDMVGRHCCDCPTGGEDPAVL